MADFHFVSRWYLEAPIEEVYEALVTPTHWPQWWPELIDVEERACGDRQGIGRTERFVWRSPLRYTLRFDMRVCRVRSPWLIEGEASGDVAGLGRWELCEQAGRTRVEYTWQVRTTRPWMGWLARAARPLVVWSHHAVMRHGAEGLARHLARPLEAAVEEPSPLPGRHDGRR